MKTLILRTNLFFILLLVATVGLFVSLGNHERNSHHYHDYMSLPDENGESFYYIQDQITFINVTRVDDEHDREYEYALTFGKSELDHLIPMYESDWSAVERFAALILK